MRPVTILAPLSTGASNVCILDQYLNPTDTLLAVEFGSASATTSVEYTPDPIYASDGSLNTSAIWFTHPTLVNLTANGVDKLDVPASAVRLNNSVWSSGQVTLQVRQSGATS